MSLMSWLAELVRPCVHVDRTVATMFDDPNNPKVTTVVCQCEICGRVAKTAIKAEGVCLHKWKTERRIPVFSSDDDKRPVYHRIEQNCVRCGEERAVDLRTEKEKK